MKPKKPHRWRRRLLWLAATVIGLRLLLAISLPWLIGQLAASIDCSATCRSASLSLLGMSLHLEGLVVRQENDAGDPPLLAAQDVFVDLSALQMLMGRVRVVDAAVSGCRLCVQRRADGTLALPAALQASKDEPPPEQPTTGSGSKSATPSLVPQFQIASARLHDLRLCCSDASSAPSNEFTLVVDLGIADLGWPDREAHLELRAHSPGRLDHLLLQADSKANDQHLAVQWQLTQRGLSLQQLPLPAGVVAWCGSAMSADSDLRGSVIARRADRDGPLEVTVDAAASVVVDGIERLRAAIAAGPTRETDAATDVPFHTELHSPGLVDRLTLEAGSLRFEKNVTHVKADLEVAACTLGEMAPWLRSLGITIVDPGVDAGAQLRAELSRIPGGAHSASLQNVSLRHGEERIDLRSLDVHGLTAAPNGIVVGNLDVDGPALRVTRGSDGAITTAGLRFATPVMPEEAPTPAPTTATGRPVVVRRIDWHGANLWFTDATLPDAPTLHVAGLTLVGRELGIGDGLPRGHATLTLQVPGSIETLRAEMQLHPGPSTLHAELTLQADGMTARSLSPWLLPAGITPDLQSGSLSCTATADLTANGKHLGFAGRLADVRLQDGDQLLVSLRQAVLSGLESAPDRIDYGTLRIDDPKVLVQQRPDACWSVAGLRFVAAAPITASGRPQSDGVGGATSATSAPATAPERRSWLCGPCSMHGASITVIGSDEPATGRRIDVDASFGPRRPDGSPAAFATTLRIPEAVESFAVQGQWNVGDGAMDLTAQIDGKGVRGAGLTPLLTPGSVVQLTNGSVQAQASVQLRTSVSGSSLDVTLRDIALRDDATELAAIDRIELHAGTVGEALVHLQSLEIQGVRADVVLHEEGLQLLGMRLAKAPSTGSLRTPSQTNAPVRDAVPALPASTWPALRIDRIDVGVHQIRFHDLRSAEATPLVFTGQLQLVEPWATATDFLETPVATLRLRASAPPLCRSLEANLRLQPFLIAPVAELDVAAEGIDTTAVANIVPTLRDRLIGTTASASLHARVHAELDLRRRDPTQFRFDRPFGGSLVVEDLQVRDTTTDAPLVSVASIDVMARAIDLRTGDVMLKSIDIDSPTLQLERRTQGIEFAGLRWQPAPTPGPVEPVAPPPAERIGTLPEFAVDRLHVQGLSFDFRDATTTPPTHLPIANLELDLHRFSTRLLSEPQTFSFRLDVQGGETLLERRVNRSSLAAGLVASTAASLAGAEDRHALEPRPVLQDLQASGHLQLYPMPKGDCRIELTGFELQTMRGLANDGSVQINDGVLDARVDAVLGAAAAKIRAGLTFTWLSMSEPPNGPISTYLRLPAPLDTVLFLLRNEADEQRIPLRMDLPTGRTSALAIAEAAIESLTLLIADAVASSPFRAAGTVTQLFAFGGPGPGLAQSVVSLACNAGEAAPHCPGLVDLPLALLADPDVKFVLAHELGEGDLRHAFLLANPEPRTAAAAIERLRRRRTELTASRNQLAVEVAARFAAAQHEAHAAHLALSRLDDEIGQNEATLDAALASLGTDTPRKRARRARKAANELGELRLQVARQALAALLPPGSDDRIEARPARGMPVSGLPEGGRVIVTPRPRAPATNQRR